MERDFRSFRRDLHKLKRSQYEGRSVMDYEEALDFVRKELGNKLVERLSVEEDEDDVKVKDKAYLREKIKEFEGYVSDIVYGNNVQVRGYEDNKIKDFIDDVVGEFVGYSVLEDARKDPLVSDIYVLDWQTIIVERDGENVPYHRTFRSPKHYKDFVERIIRDAGKEINMGDSSIVDFEIYGDRGAATSPKVSPKDYSLTIRKHSEDHLQRDDLIKGGVMNEEIADFLGTAILGETNMIYAGLTGSGKTTSIRALLDYYVTKSNKRMIVVEDTQELFPRNKHTLEFVSVKSDNPKQAVTLEQLIYTTLRLKPKYIVVGEVRGREAQAMVEGMETGHSTITTMHGGTPWNIINRLVTKYLMAMPSLSIDVVERIIGSSLDYIAIQDNIPGIGRKVTMIHEVDYDFDKRRVVLKPIFEFDFRTQEFVFKNRISKEKAQNMMRRGVKYEDVAKWMEQ